MKKVIGFKTNDDYSLDLKFNDGSAKRFDVTPYLELGVFQELKDLNYFRRAQLAYGTVQWPNEQDFGPDTLYIDGVEISELSQEKIAA